MKASDTLEHQPTVFPSTLCRANSSHMCCVELGLYYNKQWKQVTLRESWNILRYSGLEYVIVTL